MKYSPSCFCCTPPATCRYEISAQLAWTAVNFADLDLYVRHVDDSEVIWFGNAATTHMINDGDRFPLCINTGPIWEAVRGRGPFTTSQEFEAWYNQYSSCAIQTAPTTASFTVINTGVTNITVNGDTVTPGNSWSTDIEFQGYDTGAVPDHVPADSIVIQCESS